MGQQVETKQQRVIRIIADHITEHGIEDLSPMKACELTGVPPMEMMGLFESREAFMNLVIRYMNREMDDLSDQIVRKLEGVLELKHILYEAAMGRLDPEGGADDRQAQ